MPTWRCPHCGTPQAETARCWVCRRSSTACGTCRHFRRAVAGQLGYCGLDRRRAPLRGDEIRACWEASPTTTASPAGALMSSGPPPPNIVPPADRLEFIDVGTGRPVPRTTSAAPTAPAALPGPDVALAPVPTQSADPGWSLWGDADL